MTFLLRCTRHPAVFAALLAFDLALFVSTVLSFHPSVGNGYLLDLDVYRTGAQAWLDDGDLYADLPLLAGFTLPFTYPPFAAVVLAPLAMPPLWVANTLLTVVTVIVMALSTVLVARALGAPRQYLAVLAVAAVPFVLVFEPLRSNLAAGQINAVLLLLVVVDCLALTPSRYRGALVGVAAAVKLTPAAFILFFLLKRDRRAALNAVLSSAACSTIGFLCAPVESWRFWTDVLYQTKRVGGPTFTANQSITGVLARFDVPPWLHTGLWSVMGAVVVALAVVGIRKALAEDQTTLALALTALVPLLCSPISWSHHWVWAVPLVLALGAAGWQARPPLVLAISGMTLFVLGAHWWFPATGDVERTWPLWQQLLGGGYIYWGFAVLGCAAAGLLAPRRRVPATHRAAQWVAVRQATPGRHE
ncbi:glycosyltransferase 87 family protein [Lentzea sp. NBC_00516]|uniref:glycosyltransferase 87 family protein n=1 Tax=Lentzea sp. NBC_00516 TaxID=2903582 RepID=UPI002E8248B4|nr:glycosyltransferase 87 family protein [Lentzea sp. NBC_00516]WUD26299.1 glycosyltransferase 87 family protein [Lentzea sp. NBC_00516]